MAGASRSSPTSGGGNPLSDPEDNVTVDIKDNTGTVVATATRRPVPDYGTPAWDEFMREIEGKIKDATGQ